MPLLVSSQDRHAGFTLIELVVVMVVAAVLAAVVYSKVNVGVLETGGFTAEARGAIRYAQKLAVAQRRNVYVVVASNSVALCYDAACTVSNQIKDASGSWFKPTAPSGAAISGTTLFFDSLGRPNPAGTITVADSAGCLAITVEAESGFVH